MTEHQSKQWINALPKLVINYNSSYHTTIKMSPIELHGKKAKDPKVKKIVDDMKARRDQWLAEEAPRKFHDACTYENLKKGDYVRILKTKLDNTEKNTVFKKHFVSSWSKGLYQIISISKSNDTSRRAYGVQSESSEPLTKLFFRGDLLKVDPEKLIRVQKKIQPTEGVFDRELHLQKLAEQRKETKRMPRAKPNLEESVALTRGKREIIKPKKLDL